MAEPLDSSWLLPAIEDAGLVRDPKAVLAPGASTMEYLASMRKADRDAFCDGLNPSFCEHLQCGGWGLYGRTAQQPPSGDWRTWMILAGRGFGKTRAGAEWVMQQVRTKVPLRIALIGATQHEVRSVMVEGASGILSIAQGEWAPTWESSNRRLLWEVTGTEVSLYSAAEPDALRGPQHHFAWADEIAKWRQGEEVWRNLAMGLRLGHDPRCIATTTPRAVPLVRRLLAEADDPTMGVQVTRGRSADNNAHLAPRFLADMARDYGGTAFGRQELDGELIAEMEGALWSRAVIERGRTTAPPPLRRVVIGVDPPAGAGPGCDACGIVAVGVGDDARGYVLADASVQGATPEGWARAVAAAALAWGADRVVAEANNGGAMVESVLRAADAGLPVTRVHASTGKAARAEPIALFYEAGRVSHVGAFPELEDEMCGLLAGGGYEGPGRSPDRADALVWGLSELMLGKRAVKPGVRIF